MSWFELSVIHQQKLIRDEELARKIPVLNARDIDEMEAKILVDVALELPMAEIAPGRLQALNMYRKANDIPQNKKVHITVEPQSHSR